MILVGLTGSIAMGKSEVARICASQGIPVFDSDQEVHRLYESPAGADLLTPLVPQAIDVSGRIDRAVLSRLVLADPQLLDKLEALVHAEIRRRRLDFAAAAEKAGHDIVVADIPLLFETGAERDCDITLLVSAPGHLQRQRALERPGMTADKLDLILRRQMPDAEKRARADHIIENAGTVEDLREKVLAFLAGLKQMVGKGQFRQPGGKPGHDA